jgi:hypothetical protein
MGETTRRLTVSLRKHEAMRVTRVSVHRQKLVYIILADTKFKYHAGKRSRVAYIGTTKNGVNRVAQSAATRTDEILGWRGVESFEVRIVVCQPRRNVKTWRKLERAFLIRFREIYGRVPWCNSHGKNMKEDDEFKYFSKARITTLIDDLA